MCCPGLLCSTFREQCFCAAQPPPCMCGALGTEMCRATLACSLHQLVCALSGGGGGCQACLVMRARWRVQGSFSEPRRSATATGPRRIS
ncbi:hypothetical protein NDU88_000810 [Pleurodeles waltl]|uniref:Uncharacterized protein n=1 Tax=Pleurodeles waltl TaxID=8319 RepID=A0AAV7LFT2_PLEWA|nr:hypothetical protein NDU88_000810 [Pleurodeles waltl]